MQTTLYSYGAWSLLSRVFLTVAETTACYKHSEGEDAQIMKSCEKLCGGGSIWAKALWMCDFKLMPEFRSGLNDPKSGLCRFYVINVLLALFFSLLAGEMLSYGDRQEVEIRGCSLWCVELIRDCLLELIEKKDEKTSGEINSVLLDYYLWDYARDHRADMKGIPFHHTRCIYYWPKVQTDPKKTWHFCIT